MRYGEAVGPARARCNRFPLTVFEGKIPVSLVAQVSAGATAAGVISVLSHPAMSPLYGALAALVVALVQHLTRRLNGEAGPASAERKALQAAAAQAAQAAVDAAVRAALEAQAAKARQASLPKVPTLPILLVMALALAAGCGGHQLPMGGVSRNTEIWASDRWGKCVAASVDFAGGVDAGGVMVSAHSCVNVSPQFHQPASADAAAPSE